MKTRRFANDSTVRNARVLSAKKYSLFSANQPALHPTYALNAVGLASIA